MTRFASYAYSHRRKDRNHAEIAAVLKLAMIDYLDTAQFGCPFDFLAAINGRIVLIEVKDGEKSPSERRLTDDEQKLDDMLRRNGCQLHVVESPDEALDVLTKRSPAQ